MRDNIGRAKNAQIILKIYSAAMLLNIIVAYVQYSSVEELISDTINQARSGQFTSFDETADLFENAAWVSVVNFIMLGLFVANAIMFIGWFRRSYFNLHQISSDRLRYGEGMAAGAWWIPIGNLFIPYQILNELVQGYKRARGNENDNESINVGLQWGLWVAGWLVMIFGIYLTMTSMMGGILRSTDPFNGPDPTQFIREMSSMMFNIFVITSLANGLFMVSGFLLSRIVGQISKLEESAGQNRYQIGDVPPDPSDDL